MKAREPKVYPKNSPQVRAVSQGEIEIGWVNHYYLRKLTAAGWQILYFSAKKEVADVLRADINAHKVKLIDLDAAAMVTETATEQRSSNQSVADLFTNRGTY